MLFVKELKIKFPNLTSKSLLDQEFTKEDHKNKFVSFVDDLEKLGQRLDQAQSSYQDAFNKLKTGKGNLIRSAERVRELGVKPSKTLAAPLTESASQSE